MTPLEKVATVGFGLYVLASGLGKVLPGRAGAVARTIGFDIGEFLALIGKPPPADAGPTAPPGDT